MSERRSPETSCRRWSATTVLGLTVRAAATLSRVRPMHQLPLALFQTEDHRDSRSDCPLTARQLGPLYLEDVGDIGSLESRDLLIHANCRPGSDLQHGP